MMRNQQEDTFLD
uniref:Uncharacterized protein n=1 Tax=Rhizophora mucronata TaxID=61149 RepID=A0A2P2PWL8_RHIMU